MCCQEEIKNSELASQGKPHEEIKAEGERGEESQQSPHLPKARLWDAAYTKREPPVSPFLDRRNILSTLASFEQGNLLFSCFPSSGIQKSAISLSDSPLCQPPQFHLCGPWVSASILTGGTWGPALKLHRGQKMSSKWEKTESRG